MSYQALYRKFRPQNFEEVYGQDHIVTTLRNELNSNRIGHAYVFSGTRGTGKTTIAKIFAKALNCENPKNGSPCNECQTCKSINDGSSFNVHEIDGASNNGVDNVRDIIDDTSYPPIEGRYKVYIIDEVHMLSPGAFNALLKTIEEPPQYVVFILATTEIAKIPLTVLSRCQRYDFHRIEIDQIARRIEELKEAENISIENRAVKYIARQADGSMRDALSIFDQCISYFYGKEITYDMTLQMLGSTGTDMYSCLFRAINYHDAKTAVKTVEEAIVRGMEPETFVSDFVWYLRNLLLVKNGEKLEDVADISTEDSTAFLEEVEISEEDFIMRCISVLSELSANLRFSRIKRIALEVELIRLCRPQMDTDNGAILDRLRVLEMGTNEAYLPKRTVEQKINNDTLEFEHNDSVQVESDMVVEKEDKPNELNRARRGIDDGNTYSFWDEYVATLQGPVKMYASKAVIQEDDERIQVYFDVNDRSKVYFSDEDRAEEFKNSVSEFMNGKEIVLNFVEKNKMPRQKNIDEDNSESAVDRFFNNVKSAGIIVEEEE